ncbi:hypothetical protein ACKP2L_06960 [Oenococcus alcoholitolerans]|uniref:hypothetical protein n=1 Tax=Oenococcus alcoholitolerans TaxID=931074 RepID=UPI003F72F03D
MQIKDKISRLLEEQSAYSIAKKTKVSAYTLGQIKKGKSQIENLSLKSAQALADLYDENLTKRMQKKIGIETYNKILVGLSASFQKVISERKKTVNKDWTKTSEGSLSEILELILCKAIHDPDFIKQCTDILIQNKSSQRGN